LDFWVFYPKFKILTKIVIKIFNLKYVTGEWLQFQDDANRYNAEPGMLLGYENMCYTSTDTVYHQSVNNFDSRNTQFLPSEFNVES